MKNTSTILKSLAFIFLTSFGINYEVLGQMVNDPTCSTSIFSSGTYNSTPPGTEFTYDSLNNLLYFTEQNTAGDLYQATIPGGIITSALTPNWTASLGHPFIATDIEYDPTSNRIFTVDFTPNLISVDLGTGVATTHFTVGGIENGIKLIGNLLYVTDGNNGTNLYVFDVTTDMLVNTFAGVLPGPGVSFHGLDYAEESNTLFYGDNLNGIFSVDQNTGMLTNLVPNPVNNFEVDPEGLCAYYPGSDMAGTGIFEVNLSTGTTNLIVDDPSIDIFLADVIKAASTDGLGNSLYYGTLNGDIIEVNCPKFDFFPPPPPIPTLGEWGLIILSLLTIVIGIVAIRKRNPIITIK